MFGMIGNSSFNLTIKYCSILLELIHDAFCHTLYGIVEGIMVLRKFRPILCLYFSVSDIRGLHF